MLSYIYLILNHYHNLISGSFWTIELNLTVVSVNQSTQTEQYNPDSISLARVTVTIC